MFKATRTAAAAEVDPVRVTDQKTAIELYRIVAAYLQYENGTFHVRNTFFTSISVALAAFEAGTFTKLDERLAQPLPLSICCLILCAFGLWFSHVWGKTLRAIHTVWIQRWITALKQLEDQAFGTAEITMFKEVPRPINHKVHSNVSVIIQTSRWFFWGWAAAGAFEMMLIYKMLDWMLILAPFTHALAAFWK